MNINIEKYFENKKKILAFIEKNRSKYITLGNWMKKFIEDDLVLSRSINKTPVVLMQILSKFNVYSDGYDPYKELAKLLEKYSFLEGNCCEVGAGNYPRLAELTAPQIKLKKGTLTIYEPNILFTKIDNVTIIKDKFKKSTNINHIDTIYGMFPCEASITIAEKAFEEDKNLLLAFCSCDHSTKEHPKWLGTYWAEDFCMDYREKYGHEVEIIDWPTTIGIDFPIMVRQKIKK